MKLVVLLSKTFFPQHPKAGQKTDFAEKVMVSVYQAPIYGNYYKLHTCRSNYKYWKEKIDKLKAEGGVLSIREWIGKPFKKPGQDTIIDIPAEIVGIQKLQLYLYDDGCMVASVFNEEETDWDIIPLETLASNDGLTAKDFKSWFLPVFEKEKKDFLDFAIIHFTKFRY